MKVLFAVSSESISEAIVKKYQKEYKEILSYKNVYYFNAILKEIQKDKSYDRIVVSEDLEAFSNNNYEAQDKFIFEKLDDISDEAQDIDGNETSIILIAGDRHTKGSSFLVKLFGIGIYNALLGTDRSMDNVCKLINKPRTKKEAKIYYKIDADDVNYSNKSDSEVSELEIQNILTHFKKLGKNTDKYAESFNSIATQYTDEQLKIVINCLPVSVKAVLENECKKYQELMSVNGVVQRVNSQEIKSKEARKQTGIKIDIIENKMNQNKISGPIVIPGTVKTSGKPKPRKAAAKAEVKTVKVAQAKEQAEPKIVKKKVIKKEETKEMESAKSNKATKKSEIKTKVLPDGRVVKVKPKAKQPAKSSDVAEEKQVQKSESKKVKKTALDEKKEPKKVVKKKTAEENVKIIDEKKKAVPKKKIELPEDIDLEEDLILPEIDDSFEDEEFLPGMDEVEIEEEILPGVNDEFEEDDEDEDILPGIDDEFEEDEEDVLPGIDDEFDEDEEDILPGIDDEFDEDEEDVLPGIDDEFEEDDEDILPEIDDEFEEDALPEIDEVSEEDDTNQEEFDEDDYTEEVALPGLDDLDDLDNEDNNIPNTPVKASNIDEILPEIEEDDDILGGLKDDEEVVESKPVVSNAEIASIKPRIDYSMSSLNSLLTKDKKIVTFLGTTKNGTSFLVNNLAALFSSLGINTAILDTTKNKNSYYIYTNNEEELRNIAYNSISKLQKGFAEGIKVNRNLSVYTALPNDGKDYSDAEPILSTLVQNHSLVLIDCDFETDPSYFASCQEIYLVQSMDILTIQPLTAFLRDLKTKGVLESEKVRVVINKELKVRSLTTKAIIGGMSFYNDPSMSFMTELFNKDMVKACSIPFEDNAYSKYLDSMVNCNVSINGYSKTFLNKLKNLGEMVYPLVSKPNYGAKASPQLNYGNPNFSNNMGNTLNKMKKNKSRKF